MRNRKLEQNFWRNGLKPKLDSLPGMHYDRIETGGTSKSVPDVAYSYKPLHRAGHHGWIELKACAIERDDVVDLGHFTSGQRRFLMNRGEVGDNCFLMVRADFQVFLIPWDHIKDIPYGKVKLKLLRGISDCYWSTGIKVKDLKEFL